MIVTGSAPSFLPAPRGADVAWVLLAGLGGMTVVGLAIAVLGLWLGGPDYALLGVPGAVLGAAVGLWVSLVRRRGWGWAELGFVSLGRSAWRLCWEVPVALIASFACTQIIGSWFGGTVALTDSSNGSIVTAAVTVTPWLLVVVALCVVVLLSAAEEVIFRRVILGWLLTRMPRALAVMVGAAIFAAIHLLPVTMTYLFFLAVAANLIYLRHRSLWAPLALHAINNGLALTLTSLSGI